MIFGGITKNLNQAIKQRVRAGCLRNQKASRSKQGVPHGAGDLVDSGGTSVERSTRFVVLFHMPTRKADVAASAFAGALNAIPAPLRKTLTHTKARKARPLV